MTIRCFIATKEKTRKSTKKIRVTKGKDPFDQLRNMDPQEGLIVIDVSKIEIPPWQLEAFVRAGEHSW